MTACKCRRCGKLYEPYTGIKISDGIMEANGVIFINTNLSGEQTRTTVMDLCPDCMQEEADLWGGAK